MDFLIREKDLERYTLLAVDGEVGRVSDLFFDDDSWAVRYLLVNTNGWLTGRQVLISRIAMGEVRDADKTLRVELTRKQIENSPPLSSGESVSRQYEEEYHRYYNWPPYWELGGRWQIPWAQRSVGAAKGTRRAKRPTRERMQLRSTSRVKGYSIIARDGEIGHVHDFVIDSQYWAIRYIVINTRSWWPGKLILVNPGWIERVSWPEQAVEVGLTRELIGSAPEFVPEKVITREYEAELFKHYGRQVYWKRTEKSS